MQVSVEKTSELNRKMTVNIPEEVVQEKMEARFKSLAREVKLDGFRPGKVPISVVKKQFGDRVRGEIAGDLIEKTYFDALKEQELVPAGQPHIHPDDDKEGLVYIAEFEVYPIISLQGIDQLEISKPVATVTESDLENMITKLRDQKKEWNPVEREAQEGDRVTMHFSGICEGENFTDGTVSDYQAEIGAKQMIPGFEDELVGLKSGAEKTFELNFPEKYGNEKLAGKTAQFEVEIVAIEESQLPEVDAEFITSYGVENGEMDAFRAGVKDNMERELELGLKSRLKNSVMNAVFENIKITAPNSLIDNEIQEMMKPYVENAKKQNLKLEEMNLPTDFFEKEAKRRVSLALILGEIIREKGIKVDPDKVRTTVESMAESYDTPEEVFNWYYGDESRLQEVQQMVMEDQTVEWIVSQAKTIDETVSFDEVMEKQD